MGTQGWGADAELHGLGQRLQLHVQGRARLGHEQRVRQQIMSLAETLAMAPRQADGSLPDNGFARLVQGSDLIEGADVGLPFKGAAPDLGAFER